MHKVLVVEDWLPLASYIRALLEYAGLAVVGPAANVADAIRLAETPRLDAGVLDLDLHGELVFPVAYKLRERGLPILFVSGAAQRVGIPADLVEVPLLAKPFDSEELVKRLRQLLRPRDPSAPDSQPR